LADSLSKKFPGDNVYGHPVNSSDLTGVLDNISFHLESGKILGVIGSEKAGKSTLLNILAKVFPPSDGRAWTDGQVNALLKIGGRFHPELSGRDNIMLTAAWLGKSVKETLAQMDNIIEFAEASLFIDNPVKRYSNAMLLQLDFAIQSSLIHQIMIIDDVFDCMEESFRNKSLKKIHALANSGKTILLASTDLTVIKANCDQCLYLESGKLVYYGASQKAVELYMGALNGVPSRQAI
jgi:ABC-type polysaccharide/polyol phosphate transport system ATPase subunit